MSYQSPFIFMFDRIVKIRITEEGGLSIGEFTVELIETPSLHIFSVSYAIDPFRWGYRLSQAFPDAEIEVAILQQKKVSKTNLLT